MCKGHFVATIDIISCNVDRSLIGITLEIGTSPKSTPCNRLFSNSCYIKGQRQALGVPLGVVHQSVVMVVFGAVLVAVVVITTVPSRAQSGGNGNPASNGKSLAFKFKGVRMVQV